MDLARELSHIVCIEKIKCSRRKFHSEKDRVRNIEKIREKWNIVIESGA